MRVLVQQNAGDKYYHRCYRKAPANCGMLHNPEWAETLRQVEGTWVEV